MNSGKKECLGCRELIHEKATKCPHCHQIQSKLFMAQTNKWVLLPLLLLLFGFLFYLLNDIRRIGAHGQSKALLVEPSNLYARSVSGRDFVSCSGVIVNETTTLDASYISLRADFYNSKNELIDTFMNDGKLKIKAGSKSPYRVRNEADKPLSEYSKCSVTVLE
jgi:hypothetical protein